MTAGEAEGAEGEGGGGPVIGGPSTETPDSGAVAPVPSVPPQPGQCEGISSFSVA